MTESHRLHEARIDGAGISPAGAFAVDPCGAPRDITVIELSGELDMAATTTVRSHVDEAIGRRGLVLDLSAVTFLDSSMLRELLRAAAELERHETRLVLAGIPPVVRRLLELTRTSELFTIADDGDAAAALLD
jgi:anti-sigma B factor antagonist